MEVGEGRGKKQLRMLPFNFCIYCKINACHIISGIICTSLLCILLQIFFLAVD